jgi:hypothetical protein
MPRQILTKSKNFKIQNFFWEIVNLNQERISQNFFLNFEIFWTLSKFDAAIAGPNQKRLLQILDMSYIKELSKL